MTRSAAREIAVHCAYSIAFTDQTAEAFLRDRLTPETFQRWQGEDPLYQEYPNEKQAQYIAQLVRGVGDHGPELDAYIEKYAKNWKFSRISRTAAAIMRVAMYEILYMPDIPNGAAINEAVEIAKGYEEAKVVSFINGILGSFVREEFAQLDSPRAVKETEEAPAEETAAVPTEEAAAGESAEVPAGEIAAEEAAPEGDPQP